MILKKLAEKMKREEKGLFANDLHTLLSLKSNEMLWISRIAEVCDISTSHADKIVDKLEAFGLVKVYQEENPDGRPRKLLKLTKFGRRFVMNGGKIDNS